MDDLSRSEYPAMLANLQPSQAVQVLSDRVKRIGKLNTEIADWLQERRRVEELYVNGLKKLLVFKVPQAASDLGIFQAPWDKVLQSTDAIAASHQLFAQRVEKDVEVALRGFQNKKEMQSMQTISSNLSAMARELDEAQDKADKLSKRGAKASAQKVEQANIKLESATQQWESQAPFIFESLQALDEQRTNHLRDVLTQLETHEVDQATRCQAAAEGALNVMLEIDTASEIASFAHKTTVGKPKLERKQSIVPGNIARQTSTAASSTLAPPNESSQADDMSEHSGPRDGPPAEPSRLRSRIGTMLGRRRQSIHGGFGPISSQKGLAPFGQRLGSSHGRTISPRASSHNLAESHHRLSSLAESPTAQGHQEEKLDAEPSSEATNGVHLEDNYKAPPPASATTGPNGAADDDIFGVPPPPGPPPAKETEGTTKDAEGFTVPPVHNDLISQAEREAASEEADHLFKVDIKSEPIAEEDQGAKQAALSNVAQTLTQMAVPARKLGTVRGRRDVRHTIYMPSPVPEQTVEVPLPPSSALPVFAPPARPATGVNTLASETSVASDTQSVRSGTSVGGASLGGFSRLRHPDFQGSHGPGLHASLIETVSATFEGGVVKSAKANGEIAFAYNPDPNSTFPTHETIRLNNFPNLDAIGPNRAFVSNTGSADEFSVDLSHLAVTTPAFTYRVHSDADAALAHQCPLSVQPAWKPQGDKLGLLLQYKLNPDCALPRPVILSNLVLVATYEGRASNVQTKPSGTHLKDKHIVYWRIGDVTLTEESVKIICRIVGEQGQAPAPGHIEARWEYTPPTTAETIGSGISISRLLESKGKGKAIEEVDEEDPFADAGTSPSVGQEEKRWADVPLARKLISGKYEAK